MNSLQINHRFLLLALLFFMVGFSCKNSSLPTSMAFSTNSIVSTDNGFALLVDKNATPIYVSSEDHKGVLRVVKMFQEDIERVTSVKPDLITHTLPSNGTAVLVGTIGKSSIIDQLIFNKKIDVSSIEGKWETFLIETVKNPIEGVEEALVIVGSDKRGTIYGMFDISYEMGVSPLYFWADVPVKKKQNVYIIRGSHTKGTPKVKYRGIFINDEAPALSGWAFENFDGFNAQFYDHVFELILRMKGNYLWPSMWGRMFYVNDPQNPVLANEYGIVMGTSHHEPLTRAHAEWKEFGEGDWNYATNPHRLREFWKGGMERMGDTETIVSIGMRGDGDEPMTENTAIELLETIVKDQRQIIAEATGKPTEQTPQMWALYKEVMDYYDNGMRVPDDVTLLLCDDNWGNIRKLPTPDTKPRKGGYGIYYHFDYVGGPRNYKWVNTNPISRTWEQMHLAYEMGADRLWVVNVGDIKPMEFPIEFFLDYAWNPEAIGKDDLQAYTEAWVGRQFGIEHTAEIADLISTYTKYNARRKPELLSPQTYSLVNFNEAETVVADYNKLAERAKALNEKMPNEYQDAFYQLVLHPIEACANLNELYTTAAKNKWYVLQGRALTNDIAQRVRDLFEKDSLISHHYNHIMADGKWNHMMDQTHIGYTYWQQPPNNNMPKVTDIELPEKGEMGVAVEGSLIHFPNPIFDIDLRLPDFDKYHRQKYYVEVFNKGKTAFSYEMKANEDWIKIEQEAGEVDDQHRNYVSIDWDKAPKGTIQAAVNVESEDKVKVPILFTAHNPNTNDARGFVESNGYISIEASSFSNNVKKVDIAWVEIPDLGRTGSAMTPFPVTTPTQNIGEDTPHLEYNIHLTSTGTIKVKTFLSPTLNYHSNISDGLKYAVSIDRETPQIVNMHSDVSKSWWGESVANAITHSVSEHQIETAGNHILKIWMVDAGVVLQKIVLETTDQTANKSYLGPPESMYVE
ncbi:MAG: glycosyl hydrolase 115 family protein [Chitinophagales bacterium]